MTSLPEPLKTILRDFFHVEWYEIEELTELVKSGEARFDVSALEEQFRTLLISVDPPLDEINSLTANNFESSDELKDWILPIISRVFDS